MGIGEAHQFQQALYGAIFAETAMQGIEHRIRLCLEQLLAGIVAGIQRAGVKAFLAQRLDHAASRRERDFPFGGTPTHQHGDLAELGVCHGAAPRPGVTPTRLISHSKAMPDLSLTRLRTSSPKASRSAAVASPVLIRKLVCFSLTWAAL